MVVERNVGTDEGAEAVGDELRDVFGWGEVAAGFGLAPPVAKEFEDGVEKFVGRQLRRVFGGGGRGIVRFELVERFYRAKQDAHGGQVDLRRLLTDFFAPDFGCTLVAMLCFYLGWQAIFDGIRSHIDEAQEAYFLRGSGEFVLGKLVADVWISGATARGEPIADVIHDLRDSGLREIVVSGDGELVVFEDDGAFVDFEVAGGGCCGWIGDGLRHSWAGLSSWLTRRTPRARREERLAADERG